jgi:hypothetical protein
VAPLQLNESLAPLVLVGGLHVEGERAIALPSKRMVRAEPWRPSLLFECRPIGRQRLQNIRALIQDLAGFPFLQLHKVGSAVEESVGNAECNLLRSAVRGRGNGQRGGTLRIDQEMEHLSSSRAQQRARQRYSVESVQLEGETG